MVYGIGIMKHKLFRVDYKNIKDHVKLHDVADIVIMAGTIVALGAVIIALMIEMIKAL